MSFQVAERHSIKFYKKIQKVVFDEFGRGKKCTNIKHLPPKL